MMSFIRFRRSSTDTIFENPGSSRAKRLFDVSVALAGLIIAAPLIAGLAFVVRLSSPGPILYRAHRVGLNGRSFQMLKFRTMIVKTSSAGPKVTGVGDPRITSVGRILRHCKLDEVPQLWNVLRGDMSLVGPR